MSVGHAADCSKFVGDSAKASVSKTVVRTWFHAHVIRGRPKGSSVALKDEMDVISQVDRHLTAQCLAHQTGEFELTRC